MEWKIAIFTPGDHIRVKRDYYYHHGIYVGNGEVIHFTAPNNDGINDAESVLVRKTSIQFFLKDGVGEKAVYSRKEARRLNSTEEIVNLAEKSLGKGGYNIINNNCEHFANSVTFRVKKEKNIGHNPLYTLLRYLVKFTGFFAYWIYVKPKHYYANRQAKKDAKIKNGGVIISNHTSIFDYYVFVFKYLFRIIHAMVAEVVYKRKGMRTLCNAFENIEVNRFDNTSVKGYLKAKKYLEHNKTVLIFPEGHIENNKGQLEDFSPSAILLAFETNKPIIPTYVDGNYGIFKRVHYLTGNAIDVRKLVGKDSIGPEDVKMVKEYIYNVFNKLKHQLEAYKTYKTHELVSKRTYVMDFVKITSIPIGYMLLRAKKIYVGNKKLVKEAMKEKVILAPNHTSMYDVVFMYLYFFSRRIRIIALNRIWDIKILRFGFNRSGVIKYNRDAPGGFDLKCYKESNGVLEGNGALTIFPQGHITQNGSLEDGIKGGVGMLSLKHNAPIIPIIFADETAFFKLNSIVIGDPIRPTDVLGLDYETNNENLDKYCAFIYEKMRDLQAKSVKFSRKNKKKEEKICSQK